MRTVRRWPYLISRYAVAFLTPSISAISLTRCVLLACTSPFLARLEMLPIYPPFLTSPITPVVPRSHYTMQGYRLQQTCVEIIEARRSVAGGFTALPSWQAPAIPMSGRPICMAGRVYVALPTRLGATGCTRHFACSAARYRETTPGYGIRFSKYESIAS